MSRETLQKQQASHPDLTPSDYLLVQTLVDGGSVWKEGSRHLSAILGINGRLWHAVVKRTRDRTEAILVTHHRASPKNIRRAERRGKKLR